MTHGDASQIHELIILGGGCAGLSLAARLLHERPDIALIIVEPRTRYEEDRTWCGWRISQHFFSDCVVAQSDTWRIVTPSGSRQLSSPAYPYETIRASLVYEKACKIIHSSPSAELLAGAEGKRVSETDEHVDVHLADGTTLRSRWVIDTRPHMRELTEPWLWQNFVGYVIQVDRPARAFDQIPTLMEFQPPAGSVAQFMYTIPFSKDTFLCECTRFSRVHGEAPLLESELQRWLRQRVGDEWSMLRKEQGSLPMAPPLSTTQRRVIQAGTRGGSMRISTGYAFHRIQRWADTCAQSILQGGIPVPPAGNPLLDAMDELFLRVLQQPSTSAAEIFGDLFRACPTDRLVRFLSGVPRPYDLWTVAQGLPWGKFLRQAPRLADTWISGTEREA